LPNPIADLIRKQTAYCWNKNRQQGQLDAVVVTSSEAMRYLIALAAESIWIKHVSLCVNHPRIAELPKSLGFKVLVADAPGDAAMLACLSRLYSQLKKRII
jgi:Uroporphyrinogen-III synthase